MTAADENTRFPPEVELDDVVGFAERVAAQQDGEQKSDVHTFEGVEFSTWRHLVYTEMGVYDPEVDPLPVVGDDGSRQPSPYAESASAYAEGVRSAFRDAWGEPVIRRKRLDHFDSPEGAFDVMMDGYGADDVEVWTRGEWVFGLLTTWAGERDLTELRQVLALLPRDQYVDFAILVDGEERRRAAVTRLAVADTAFKTLYADHGPDAAYTIVDERSRDRLVLEPAVGVATRIEADDESTTRFQRIRRPEHTIDFA